MGINKAAILVFGTDSLDSFIFKLLAKSPEEFIFFPSPLVFDPKNPNPFKALLHAEDVLCRMEKLVKKGAKGFKMYFKPLTSLYLNASMDDPRMDHIYEKAGELEVPILVHQGDPQDFWWPMNEFNFWRYTKGPSHGHYWRCSEALSREEIFQARENVLQKHPDTTFILAHMGWLSTELPLLAYLFDTYPNMYADCAAAVEELCRKTRESRAFFIKYADRILFGTDASYPQPMDWRVRLYKGYYMLLETDATIDPSYRRAFPVDGLNLPTDVLKKVYYENAEKIILKE